MTDVQAVELEYIDPRSNSEKFYRVFRIGTVTVNQYGRIGTFGSFTPRKDAGSEEKSIKVFEKAVAGKLAKGYNIVGQGTIEFEDNPTDSDLDREGGRLPDGAVVTSMPTEKEQSAVVVAVNSEVGVDPGILHAVIHTLDCVATRQKIPAPTNPTRPMLATSTSDLAGLLESDRYDAQLKLDGDRVVVEVINGVVSALNRQGQPKVKNVGADMLAPFRHLTKGRWVFDGEVVGRTLWLFDMPAAGDYHDESAPWSVRSTHLNQVYDTLILDQDENSAVGIVITYSGDTKGQLLEYAMDNDKEGVIFRDVDGAYESGKRSKVLWKYKFLNEADCIVGSFVEGKDSVYLGVWDDNDEWVEVGQASTIGKSPAPQINDVWEVRFLYVVSAENPRMVQPRLMRKRTDKYVSECSLDQFASAVTDKSA